MLSVSLNKTFSSFSSWRWSVECMTLDLDRWLCYTVSSLNRLDCYPWIINFKENVLLPYGKHFFLYTLKEATIKYLCLDILILFCFLFFILFCSFMSCILNIFFFLSPLSVRTESITSHYSRDSDFIHMLKLYLSLRWIRLDCFSFFLFVFLFEICTAIFIMHSFTCEMKSIKCIIETSRAKKISVETGCFSMVCVCLVHTDCSHAQISCLWSQASILYTQSHHW